MRRAGLALLALLAAIPAADGRRAVAPTISARPVALDPADPARRQVGALRYLEGWVLTSNDRRFGGISSIFQQDGRFTALSDDGMLFRFRLGARGQIGEVRFRPLPAVPGARGVKGDRDSESMQHDPASGRTWVGFEQHNQIWRYAPRFDHAEAHAAPAAMADWPGNGGPEAMVRLKDGRFIVFSEEAEGPGETREALLFPGDPSTAGARPVRFFYRPPEGYVPTDAAQLPDGRLVVLNRHFTIMDGVSATVTIADPRDIKADSVMAGREVARLGSPLTVDNMEALSLAQEGGRTILWIASDDNKSPIQRTLLLKFALEER